MNLEFVIATLLLELEGKGHGRCGAHGAFFGTPTVYAEGAEQDETTSGIGQR